MRVLSPKVGSKLDKATNSAWASSSTSSRRVKVDELVGTNLRHEVAGTVVAVWVEHACGGIGAFVVAGEQVLGFDKQLTPGVRTVALELAQVRHVGELEIGHLRSTHPTVDQYRPSLSRAVAFDQMYVEERLDPRL
jgi:hypothetical protein